MGVPLANTEDVDGRIKSGHDFVGWGDPSLRRRAKEDGCPDQVGARRNWLSALLANTKSPDRLIRAFVFVAEVTPTQKIRRGFFDLPTRGR